MYGAGQGRGGTGTFHKSRHLEGQVTWCIWSDWNDAIWKSLSPFPHLSPSVFSTNTIWFNQKFCSTSLGRGQRWKTEEWPEGPSLHQCPFPSAFDKADTPWREGNQTSVNHQQLFWICSVFPSTGHSRRCWQWGQAGGREGGCAASGGELAPAPPVCMQNVILQHFNV